jgi:methanethiol S-methyltransferase
MKTAAGAASPLARGVAWAGALVFFASLAYFLFRYVIAFGAVTADGPRAAAIAFDTLLFTLFALHHSVFARQRVRAAVQRVVPPRLERSFYVWVASVLFIAVCASWQPVPGVGWSARGPVQWALVALQAIGIWLTLHSAAMIDILELSGVRQLSNRASAIEFKTSGPYGWVRHPIYTGWMLLVFCVPVMTMTRLVFAVVSSAYLLLAIPFEERSLRDSTEGAYERYAAQVRWKLIPGLY